MAAHAGRTAHTLPWSERTSTVRHPPPNVLLVEGHADTRDLYELWLTQRAFAVTATASGDVALAAVRAQAPDVIVVELMVPDGGVPLVRALRAEAGCRDAIMIVVTTQADTALRERALEAGADFYLVKPCGVLRLGEVIGDRQPRSRAARRAGDRRREAVVGADPTGAAALSRDPRAARVGPPGAVGASRQPALTRALRPRIVAALTS